MNDHCINHHTFSMSYIYNNYMQVHTLCIIWISQHTTGGHKLFNAEHAIIIFVCAWLSSKLSWHHKFYWQTNHQNRISLESSTNYLFSVYTLCHHVALVLHSQTASANTNKIGKKLSGYARLNVAHASTIVNFLIVETTRINCILIY